MTTSETARKCIDQLLITHPELLPIAMQQGYELNGLTEASKKMGGRRFRRVKIKEVEEKVVAYTLYPCDVLPYLTGMVDDVEKALFLKRFGVPDWALTHVFGRNDSYWYRQTNAFGRYNLVGTTVKANAQIPTHLLADEKHAKAHGDKWYIATTVANDCVLGASVSATADAGGLQTAYGVFKDEALAVNTAYEPETVNTDGWAATGKAWRTLFPNITIILCFLHAFIKIRSRCKRLGAHYEQIKQQVWDIYHAPDRDGFMHQVRGLQAWVLKERASLTTGVLEALDKLCRKAPLYCTTFDHPAAYRTSNMLDRHMEPMARWLAGGRYFHGNLHAAELRVRSWALLHNYGPYCPRAKVSDTYSSPAHQFNQSVYRDNWLENLLVSSSCQGFRYKHRKREC